MQFGELGPPPAGFWDGLLAPPDLAEEDEAEADEEMPEDPPECHICLADLDPPRGEMNCPAAHAEYHYPCALHWLTSSSSSCP